MIDVWIPLKNTQLILHFWIVCCDQLIITSTGAVHDHNSAVLGTYQKDGVSNGRDSYKNANDNDRHLHFTPSNFWMVSINYTHSHDQVCSRKNIFIVFLYICNVNALSRRIKLYSGNTSISIFRYRTKKIKVLQQDTCIVRYVPATVHSSAHSGMFGMDLLGWRMQLCQYNAEVNNLIFFKNYMHSLNLIFLIYAP